MEYYKNLDLADIKYFCEIDQVEKIEQWKDIPFYKKYYEVSDLGRVKSKERVVIKSNYKLQTVKEKILRSSCGKKPSYMKVFLSKKGIRSVCKVHRLVAISFVKNPDNKPLVNHKDGIKHNNRASNLEWSTKKDNALHAYSLGLMNAPKGVDSKLSKLNIEQVLEIRRTSKLVGHDFLAKKFNVSAAIISYVVNRKTYKNI